VQTCALPISDHTVLAAGGFIVQVMPGADEDMIEQLEEQIQSIPPISSLIEKGYTPEQILNQLFQEEEQKIHEKMPITFRCQCSREILERAIKGLGNEENQSMIDEDHGA